MEAISKHIKLAPPCLAEKKDTKIQEILNLLKTNVKCVILGVARGKVSEGVDMTLDGRTMLSAVIIVGLPYPKKTELQNALFNYFKEKFEEKAYAYANEAPCVIALAQSAGRLIRSPEDKGIIVIMDSRTTGKIKQKFPEDWRKEMKAYCKIEKLIAEIQNFQNQVKEGTRE
jgi:DNA excision repair protein ERCC-2